MDATAEKLRRVECELSRLRAMLAFMAKRLAERRQPELAADVQRMLRLARNENGED